MTTVKLYDGDSHLSEFTATVISCEKCGGGFSVVLDRTAFFPEGGGQYGDRGRLNGAAVLDTQLSDGTVRHITDRPFDVGDTVSGSHDFKRRFAFMQNHSGEHIVSGIIHSLYGLDNVGFHLAEDFVTLDFNGILDREQLDRVENLANEKVWQNLGVRAYYPSADELRNLEYRSKKALSGDVRIVEIDDTDICACCAPHVSKTGEIGIIKLLDTEKMRGGTRILMKCGAFALADYRDKYLNIHSISARLSAKQENAAMAVEQLEEKLSAAKAETAVLKRRMSAQIINSFDGDRIFLIADGLERDELRIVADGLYRTYGGVRAVFSPAQNGFAFAICGEEEKLSVLFSTFKNKLSVRGGGRGGIVQGSVSAGREEISNFFDSIEREINGLDRN